MNLVSKVTSGDEFKFRFQIQVHLTADANVPDHYTANALSDPKDKFLSVECQHDHESSCPQCEELKSAFKEVEAALSKSSTIAEDVRDDLLYTYQNVVQAIQAWKAHQLWSLQQDKARITVLGQLDETKVLITQDWAMKWLPQRYRETQAEWFGKRGISWHISVVVRRVNELLQHQTFVHIVEDCNQDAKSVIQLLRHTLKNLKHEHPEIEAAALRQDNAGCYHSVAMVSACRLMEEDTGIRIERENFSDPQGGKDACDRKAATVKAHVRRYVNEGHNVVPVREFHDAMLSHGGINGVRVALVTGSTDQSQQVITYDYSGLYLEGYHDCIAPLYIQDLVQVKSQGAYNLRSSRAVFLDAPSIRTKVTLGDRAFQVAAPKLWNSLPSELRLINNIDIFKRRLKTYLF